MTYSSSLTDAEWEILEPLLPQILPQRHLAVDTLGFPFFTHCTKGNVSDDAGLLEMLTLNIDTREGSARKIWICASGGSMGDRTLQCFMLIESESEGYTPSPNS